MDTIKKRDWGLLIAGVLLIACAFFFMVAPGITLVTITLIAGVAFLVSGVFDAVSYIRFRKTMNLSIWSIVYAILDIVLGLMLIVHPVIFAGVIPWMVGVLLLVFGVFEIGGAWRIHKAGAPLWGWMMVSGVVGVICGFTFFAIPTAFSLFLSAFVLMRGLSLVLYGWNTGKAITE